MAPAYSTFKKVQADYLFNLGRFRDANERSKDEHNPRLAENDSCDARR